MQQIQSGGFTALLPDGISADAPLAVIGGWAGATDSALSKYAQLLADHGYPSVRSVASTSNLFSPVERPRRQWALALLSFLEAQRLCPAHPLVLYSFSNGGAFVVEQIKKLAEQDPRYAYLKQSVVGFVFDSSPGYMHPYMGRRVLETEMPPGPRRTLTIAAMTSMMALTPLLYGDRAVLYWREMLELDWGCPFLFLYSADDPLCDAHKLEQLIKDKRSRGQTVRAVRWEESNHCGHLRRHKEEYSAALLAFFQDLRPPPRPQARL